jgi:hypothetical protein
VQDLLEHTRLELMETADMSGKAVDTLMTCVAGLSPPPLTLPPLCVYSSFAPGYTLLTPEGG